MRTVGPSGGDPRRRDLDRRARRHLAISLLLAAGATAPLALGAARAPLFLLVPLVALSFLLNLNVVESALAELHVLRPPPRLPARRFGRGIPAAERTCAAYPVLLSSPAQAGDFLRNLERSLRENPDPHILWVVVSASPPDVAAMERRGIRALRRRALGGPVLHLHRDPAVANWEKKRGAYMHLMWWLASGAAPDGVVPRTRRLPAMPSGRVFDRLDGAAGGRVENLVIGDSDTVWPPGSVRRLVERIAHPANRRYTIFQGRIAPRNDRDSVFANLQARLYRLGRSAHGARWTVYGRVSFAGHGAGWNVRRFLRRIGGRMEDGYLSHDIVESYFLRTAFVEEVETTECVQETVQNIVLQWRRWWTGNRIACSRLLGRWYRDESGRRVRNRNPAGKLLLLEACRNYVMPVFLGGYLMLAAVLAWTADLTFLFTVVGGLYFLLVMLRFYVPLLLKVDGFRSAFRIGFTIAFLTALVQVLMIEKARIVLSDAARALAARAGGRGPAAEWIVQGSLATDRGFASALGAGWSHSVAAGALLLLLHGSASPPALLVLALVAASPLLLWLGARHPPRWLVHEA